MRVTDLAGCANLDISTVSRHVAQLQRTGLIERTPDPDDRRAQRGRAHPGRCRTSCAAPTKARRSLLRQGLADWADGRHRATGPTC